MSTTDYTIANSRVHRATCKRAPKSAVPLADATADQAVGVVPASCCKPDAEQVGRALLALSGQREAEQAWDGYLSSQTTGDRAERLAAEDGQPESPAEVTVQYDGNGLPKGLFKPLATDAAERLAAATGVQVQADRATRTVVLTGQPGQVAEAEQVVRQWWDWAYGAFREWKQTDEYRALDAKGLWTREQEWLAALDVTAGQR